MNLGKRWKKTLVWLLSAALANPVPGLAQVVSNTPVRDTAIYLNNPAGVVGEPNILIVLGTNDRMNIPEPWREIVIPNKTDRFDPADYDSHVEYLWADPRIIAFHGAWSPDPTNSIVADDWRGISLHRQPINPTSPWGNWAGATWSERSQLMLWAYYSTVLAGSLFAVPGDPGPRYLHRNYGGGASAPTGTSLGWGGEGTHPIVPWTGDANWLWWAPSPADPATPVATRLLDPLLRATSFNKFAGNYGAIGGRRGGINWPDGGNWATRNQCGASLSSLVPSTVFAPTTQPRNAGRFLDQPWLRWEPFLDTQAPLAGYPTDTPGSFVTDDARTLIAGSGTWWPGRRIRPRSGYPDSNLANPTLRMEGGPMGWSFWDSAGGPGGNHLPGAMYWVGTSAGWGNSHHPGSWGQPIRMRVDAGQRGVVDMPGDSRAGWTRLRADAGGYNFVFVITELVRANILRTTLSGLYTGFGAPGSESNAQWLAWRGNDASVPGFGREVSTPAYFSTDITTGTIAAGSNVLTVDRVNAFAVRHEVIFPAHGATGGSPGGAGSVINIPGAGPGGANLVAEVVGRPGPNQLQLSASAATAVTTPVTITVNLRLNTRDAQSCTETCAPSVAATAATGNPDALGRTLTWRPDTMTCTPSGVRTGPGCATAPTGSCAPGGSTNFSTRRVSTCVWTGRNVVFVEGVGNVFHGGACVANCNESVFPGGLCPSGASSSDYCSISAPTMPSQTFNNVTYTNVTVNNGGNGSNHGCTNLLWHADQSCTVREGPTNGGVPCTYERGCPDVVTWDTPPQVDYAVSNRQGAAFWLYHDCLADNGTPRNPGNGFLNTRTDRTFGADWNAGVSAAVRTTHAYSPNDPGGATPPNIDVYSNNFLNWRFGPRGPNGWPIGRKTRLQSAKDALSDLVMQTDGVRFGLMVTNRTQTTFNNDGANIAFAVRRMGSNASDPDFANRQLLVNAINNVVASSRTPLTESLYEAYLYFSGRMPRWGTDPTPALPSGTASQNYDRMAICAGTGTGDATGPDCPVPGAYRSPMLSTPTAAAPAACQKNFVLLITNAQPEDDWSANEIGALGVRNLRWDQPPSATSSGEVIAARTNLDSLVPDTPTGQFEPAPTPGVPFGPQDLGSTAFDSGYVWLDELAYFMNHADVSPGARNFAGETGADLIPGQQSVLIYGIGYAGVVSPVLESAAQRGGGGSVIYAQDSAQLRNALQQAITNIQSWHPSIATATVPISAYNRLQSSVDIYLAFFEPSVTQAWLGTVKKYELGFTPAQCGRDLFGNDLTNCIMGQTVLSGTTVRNIDQVQTDPVTGQVDVVVNPNAVSFWNPLTEVDGARADRGGTGFQLRTTGTPDTRNVYYLAMSGMSYNADLTVPNNQFRQHPLPPNWSHLYSRLNAPNFSEFARLVNRIRGGDLGNTGCSTFNNPCTAWSAWPHFDVLHSRPALVYYDQRTSTVPPVQVLYYLSNAGLLHAVDANTGRELWSFLVSEAFPQIAGMLADGPGEQLQAGDGSISAWVEDVNGNGLIETGDRVVLVFGLRRGGRAIYALDVTERTAPRLLWTVSGAGGGTVCAGGSCSTGVSAYAELGQTWSTPIVGRVPGVPGPVVIVGGGYDPNQDNNPVLAADTMGRAVYVLSLADGSVVRQFSNAGGLVGGGMDFSIAADLTAIDTNGDGRIDRLVFGDLGGQVWRIDLLSSNPADWAGKRLAQLSDMTHRRKIFSAPSVVPMTNDGRYDAVYVGTGDREHPLLTTSQDGMFMIVDRELPGISTVNETPTQFNQFTPIAFGTTTGAALTPGMRGWVLLMQPGQKIINQPLVFAGNLLFGTYTPTGILSDCMPAGRGDLWIVAADSGIVVRFAALSSRGYISAPQIIVTPTGQVTILVTGGGGGRTLTQQQIADIGRMQINDPNRPICFGTDCRPVNQWIAFGTRVYWFVQPER
jgi:type IV pilus assembly protein PilY1